jgi:uncharacterized oxidoreductase
MILNGRTVLIAGGSAGIGLVSRSNSSNLVTRGNVTARRESVLDEVKKRHPKLHTI